MSTTVFPFIVLLRLGILCGGLCGALGVSLMAMSVHLDGTGLLETASQMLLFHAPVFILAGLLSRVSTSYALPIAFGLLLAGLILFCGDLSCRAFYDVRLFPMAAPTGGSLTILSWIALALSAFGLRLR